MTYLLNNFTFLSNVNPTLNVSSSSNTCSVNNPDITCITCNYKCQFSFTNESFSATCYTIPSGLQFTDITTDSLSPSPITFNESNYSVVEMFLNVFSWGKYSIDPCCEIVMVCISSSGVLIICIPVTISETSQTIAVPPTIPSINGEITSSAVSGVALSNYFPESPFIYYQAPYNKSTVYADYIVFPESNLRLSVSTIEEILRSTGNTEPTFQTNIPDKTPIYYTGTIYYNSVGPNGVSAVPDEIYIECNPTDYTETQVITSTTPTPPSSFSKSSVGIISIICIGAIIVAFLGRMIFWLYQQYSKSKT